MTADDRPVKTCPICDNTERPVRRSKCNNTMLILLLLLGLWPGILYLMLTNGSDFICPNCGYKYGEA